MSTSHHSSYLPRLLLLLTLLSLLLLPTLAGADYYKILGVPRTATDRQLKKAYHRLSMKVNSARSTST